MNDNMRNKMVYIEFIDGVWVASIMIEKKVFVKIDKKDFYIGRPIRISSNKISGLYKGLCPQSFKDIAKKENYIKHDGNKFLTEKGKAGNHTFNLIGIDLKENKVFGIVEGSDKKRKD